MFYIELLLVLFIFLALNTVKCMYKESNRTYTISKVITCSFYLIIGIASYAYSREPIYFNFIPTYVFFFLGDIFLALCHTDDGIIRTKQFLIGLGSFGIGHVLFCFNLATLLNFEVKWYWFLAGTVYLIITLLNRKSPKFKFGKKLPACAAYSYIIGTVLTLGVIYAIKNFGDTASMLLGLASIAFFISDTIICFKYFGVEKKKWYGAVELILYYLAIIIISTFTCFLS